MDVGETAETVRNGFLRALQASSLARLRPHLEPVELARRQVIYAPGEEPAHIYFPNRGLVSLIKTMRDGRIVEVGAIGVEGAVCLAAILGLPAVQLESIVQIAGEGLRIKSVRLREAAAGDPELRQLLLAYAGLAIAQLAQTAACNRLHSLEQRFCRWLLVAQDSAGGDTFQVTHEFLALMLGVQRPGVSLTANALQQQGLIRYQNGRMTVADRPGLKAVACECYDAVRGQVRELLEPGGEAA